MQPRTVMGFSSGDLYSSAVCIMCLSQKNCEKFFHYPTALIKEDVKITLTPPFPGVSWNRLLFILTDDYKESFNDESVPKTTNKECEKYRKIAFLVVNLVTKYSRL